MTRSRGKVTGAGRTDAGVHATGQVVHIDTIWPHAPERLQRALNAVLSRDVVVLDLREATTTFHARYDAVARWYRYRLWAAPDRHPLEERFSYHVAFALDGDRMADEASALIGRHDFGAFGAPAVRGGRTDRHMMAATVERSEGVMTIDLIADGFLRHQVRRTVGLLIDVGRGALPGGALAAARDRAEGAPVPRRAPARGLVLAGVAYSLDGDGPSWETSLDIHGTSAVRGAVRWDGSGPT